MWTLVLEKLERKNDGACGERRCCHSTGATLVKAEKK